MVLPAASTLCQLFTFILGGSPIFYSATPRGFCSNCCNLRLNDDIKFLLYTRENRFKFQNLYVNDRRSLQRSHWNINHPLVIYIHGFSESATSEKQSSQELKDALLITKEYNVILVDWSPITSVPWYINAVENMPLAAGYISRFIRFLIENGYPRQYIHLIGFSLGAEMAGLIGKQLKTKGIILPRITGLDPAYPLFSEGSPYHQLEAKDAAFVDIIHTDGGLLGNPEAVGHADFYPNGGRPLQPGCILQEIQNNRWLSVFFGCSHQRAWQYFLESIYCPSAFPVDQCQPANKDLGSNCQYDDQGLAYMGIAADRRLRGKFYLTTNDAPPYGCNRLGPTNHQQYNMMKATAKTTMTAMSFNNFIQSAAYINQIEYNITKKPIRKSQQQQ